MWPKLLDMSPEECRGMLRRLELQSYSNVVSTFRSQGILNEMKIKILKDLRDAFHISDDRHRAEVRRVVNDEAFSTIAKVVYGPNSEIEWNKEGARGFSILARTIPQTALSLLADKAAELGDKLNAKLPQPANTQRTHVLRPTDDDSEFTPKIITADPLQAKIESKRQIASPIKPKPLSIDWNTTNKSRKRGGGLNKLNSPNIATRIQQLYNSHNPKTNVAPSQRKPSAGPSASRVSAKSVGVTNRRRKSELLSPNARSIEPLSAAVHSTEHSIGDNEYQLQEEEVNSVPLHSHRYKFNNPTSNDVNVQMVAAKQSPKQMQQIIVTSVPNASTNLPHIGAARPSQTQMAYQQQPSAPKMTKATPAAVATTNVMLENSNQSNGPSHSTSQFGPSHKNSNVRSTTSIVTATTTTTTATTTQRIPPKISILSQQTITKSNINFVPLADNKIIIKSDSKLANAFKSQKIQMIPGQISSTASSSTSSSSSLGGNKMHPQNSLIIRGTSQHTMHPKVFSVPLNSNHHQNAQAFYVNLPTTQSPSSIASIHTIEKVITDETPVEIVAAEMDDYIIEDTTGGTAYELVEQNVDDTAAYVTTTTKLEPTRAKRAKLLSNSEHRRHDIRQRMSFVTPKLLSNAIPSQQFRTHVANNDLVSTIIYEDHPTSTDWEYELDYGGKPNGNGKTIVKCGHADEAVVEDDATEYHESNIIYTEEEIIDDENVLQEEYVTTEVFPPNDNVIEMEIDSLIL